MTSNYSINLTDDSRHMWAPKASPLTTLASSIHAQSSAFLEYRFMTDFHDYGDVDQLSESETGEDIPPGIVVIGTDAVVYDPYGLLFATIDEVCVKWIHYTEKNDMLYFQSEEFHSLSNQEKLVVSSMA